MNVIVLLLLNLDENDRNWKRDNDGILDTTLNQVKDKVTAVTTPGGWEVDRAMGRVAIGPPTIALEKLSNVGRRRGCLYVERN